MNHEIGGWPWLLNDVVPVVVLAGGIADGTILWRRYERQPIAPAARDRTTKKAYRR